MNEHKSVINDFAIASLVVGIVSFISLAGMEKAIVAIVFGALAFKRIRKDNQLPGKNLAQAGIILGILSIIVTVVFLVRFFPKIQQQMRQMQHQYNLMEKGEDSSIGPQSELIPTPK